MPKTKAANSFLTTELQSIKSKTSSNFREAWIGLHDKDHEGLFVWQDGEPLSYDMFNHAAGGFLGGAEDCVALNPSTGLWDDFRCNDNNRFFPAKKPFICQIDAVDSTKSLLKQKVDEDVEEQNDLEAEQ